MLHLAQTTAWVELRLEAEECVGDSSLALQLFWAASRRGGRLGPAGFRASLIGHPRLHCARELCSVAALHSRLRRPRFGQFPYHLVPHLSCTSNLLFIHPLGATQL